MKAHFMLVTFTAPLSAFCAVVPCRGQEFNPRDVFEYVRFAETDVKQNRSERPSFPWLGTIRCPNIPLGERDVLRGRLEACATRDAYFSDSVNPDGLSGAKGT